MNLPIKSFYLSGNLNNSAEISTRLYPFSEFGSGVWTISIEDIIYEKNVEFNNIAVGICTNLVRGYQYSNLTKSVENCNPMLKFMLFDGPVNEKQIINLRSNAFYVNNIYEDLKIFFVNLQTEQKIDVNCNVFIRVEMKKVGL